jgi:tetraacyldisaccharide 4'-kinase
MVRWLADRFRAGGRHVAILSRGYRASGAGPGDELTMLRQLLNENGQREVQVCANPDRFAAGESLLRDHPETNIFLLDDGFQHRRLARDFDIVLISAAEPFGFGHVLPRGMLREPLSGLRRANAVVITHADEVSPETLLEIESEIGRHHPTIPIYQAIHAQIGLRESSPPGSASVNQSLDKLSTTRFFAFCGIGNPESLDRQLARFGEGYAGHRWFSDHHEYRPSDLDELRDQARQAGAQALVTTEKDWVKVAALGNHDQFPIWRIDIRIQFLGTGEEELMRQIEAVLNFAKPEKEKRLHDGG